MALATKPRGLYDNRTVTRPSQDRRRTVAGPSRDRRGTVTGPSWDRHGAITDHAGPRHPGQVGHVLLPCARVLLSHVLVRSCDEKFSGGGRGPSEEVGAEKI